MHILEKYILENDLNLTDLAVILDYNAGNLSRVLSGKTGVSKKLAFKIKQKLQFDIQETKRPKRYKTNKELEQQIHPKLTNSQNQIYYETLINALIEKIQRLEEELSEYKAKENEKNA